MISGRILDSHTHIGAVSRFNLPGSTLLESMGQYEIDFALVSNLEGIEFDPESGSPRDFLSQIEVNTKTLDLIKKNPGLLKGLFWIKPNTEGFSSEVKQFLTENRDYFAGFKAHPFHSKLAITHEKYRAYLEFADANGIPFAVHTAADSYSGPGFVYEAARYYRNINFVMVHMGLDTNNREAIDLIKKLPNLYGDTSWVSKEAILKALQECGSEKILFGSDSPIDGIDTYKNYITLIHELAKTVSREHMDALLYKNAARVFFE
ncbi:MAG: amidohydrolase family protein [bacterium]|nr:amidohydrolase family protein [bacterium]